MSFLKKIVKGAGKVVKKVAPIAAGYFAPGLIGAAGKAVGAQLPASMKGAWGSIGQAAGSIFSSAKGVMSPSLIAGIAGDIYSGKQMQKAADDQMDFQREMSNTAHQREVKDLKAAGLNPILSGMGGMGASSPSGAMADVPDYGKTASSAGALKLMQAQLANVNAQTQNTMAGTANTQTQTARTQLEIEKEKSGQPYWGDRADLDYKQGLKNYEKTAKEILKIGKEIDNILANTQNTRGQTALTATERARAERLLKDLMDDPDLRRYIQSAPYGERVMFDRIIKGGADSSTIAQGLKIARDIIR